MLALTKKKRYPVQDRFLNRLQNSGLRQELAASPKKLQATLAFFGAQLMFITPRFSHFWRLVHRHRHLMLLFLGGLFTLGFVGCSGSIWQNQGDSCIHTSEEPPLRRVVNYSDHDLCGRKLPPRTPPNPRTRLESEME